MNNNLKESLKNLSNKSNLYQDAILEEDWVQLINKHKLRYEIWMILRFYQGLNVTEISHLVRQSKSTVSRVLIQMEKDDLVKSKRATKKKSDGEKIPPKFYRINEEYNKKVLPEVKEFEQIEDPSEIKNFYKLKITNFRNAIYNYHKLLDLLTPMLNIFEDQLEDIKRAKEIYNMYFSGDNEPFFHMLYFDEEHFKEFLDIRLEYLLKLEKLAREQELNTDNVFTYFDASISLKAIFEMKKEVYLRNK